MSKKFGLLVLAVFLLVLSSFLLKQKMQTALKNFEVEENRNLIIPPLTFSPTATPTPAPLTFEQMNELYGPCVRMPVLFYHHVQSSKQAQAKNQTSLTVNTETFRKQMVYLKQKGYQTVNPSQLITALTQGGSLPANPVMITFDDGYADFASQAAPILQENGFQATVFLITGLMDNPDYLNWDQIAGLKGAGHFFGNHTWSHANVGNAREKAEKEILTANDQLANHNLNSPKIFAYPLGFSNPHAETYLSSLGYQLGFTTNPGSTLCFRQKLTLPRVRIGNASLSAYGL